MSILATMFVKLFDSKCAIALSRTLFCCFCSIVKLQKQKTDFFHFEAQPKIVSVACAMLQSTLKHYKIFQTISKYFLTAKAGFVLIFFLILSKKEHLIKLSL